jgi:hypothetical protein
MPGSAMRFLNTALRSGSLKSYSAGRHAGHDGTEDTKSECDLGHILRMPICINNTNSSGKNEQEDSWVTLTCFSSWLTHIFKKKSPGGNIGWEET